MWNEDYVLSPNKNSGFDAVKYSPFSFVTVVGEASERAVTEVDT